MREGHYVFQKYMSDEKTRFQYVQPESKSKVLTPASIERARQIYALRELDRVEGIKRHHMRIDQQRKLDPQSQSQNPHSQSQDPHSQSQDPQNNTSIPIDV